MRKLDKLGGNSKEVLTKSVKDCTVFVRDDARLRCPVDTGDLRHSIDYKVEIKDSGVTGTVYTNMEYAPYVEFGTGIAGQSSNTNSKVNVAYRQDWQGMKAQPYLYPALDQNQEQIKKKIANDIRKAIRRVANT